MAQDFFAIEGGFPQLAFTTLPNLGIFMAQFLPQFLLSAASTLL